jgi:hypothetical protein
MSTQLRQVEAKIVAVKRQLLALGPMRPGSISQQYRQPKSKRRPFFQISYTHHMRSHSEYVRPEHLAALRRETTNFKRFKRLVQRWIDLALSASKLRLAHPPQKPRRTT